ncbi:MAG: phage holin family protein [Saprospiraceae bacterium]|nr:phage holin family protein [Candidatus Defluviibacterium haderslevense]
MEKTYEKAEELITNIKSYINLRIDGLKLEIAEKTAEIVTNLIVSSVVFIVFLLFIVFASIALAFGLGEWLENHGWAF